MKKSHIINSLIESENEVILGYKNYISSLNEQEISSLAEDSIIRHSNHVESLKKLLREEV